MVNWKYQVGVVVGGIRECDQIEDLAVSLKLETLGFPAGSVIESACRGWPLIREDPSICRATKPVRHKYWTCALSPGAATPASPCALEYVFSGKRSHHKKKPSQHN